MILLFSILATCALVAAALAGRMTALRTLAASQRGLEERSHAAETRVAELVERASRREAEVDALRDEAARARQEIGALQATIATAKQAAIEHQAEMRAAQRSLSEATATHAGLRAELGIVQERLAQRESGQAREGRAVAEVQRVLAPLIERERLAGQLARLDVGRGTRGELPRLMDAIASVGGFSSVVLSDEAGLPLAVNQTSTDGDVLAGVWSLLLTVADRIATAGAPVPIALVVHDAANQTILHRLFSSAGSRFLLTAVSRGRSLGPEALDPALAKLERMLAGSALAS